MMEQALHGSFSIVRQEQNPNLPHFKHKHSRTPHGAEKLLRVYELKRKVVDHDSIRDKTDGDGKEEEQEVRMRFWDRNSLLQSMKSCGRRRNLREAKRIHNQVKEFIKNDLHLGTGLLSMLAKCGALDEAQNIFEELRDRDAISWNALMGGFTLSGHGESALECFWQMQEQGILPNEVTFLCVLQACGIGKCIELGKRLHAELEEEGLFRKQILLGTTLVDMYAKCGMLETSKRVFEELPERNVVSWSALIAGYVEHGRSDEALECFMQMQHKGITPNSITFLCVLKACGNIGCLELGEKVHREVKKQGLLDRNLMLGTTLVDMYAKCGNVKKAKEVFDQLSERDVVSWGALITGYTQHGHGDKALECFRQMVAEDICPDAIIFICMLKVCGNEGYLEMGEEIHAQINEKGFLEKDIVMGNTLVDMYVKCNMLRKAHEVLRKLPKRDVVTWTALIGGYAHHGSGDVALKCFQQMRKEGISPNEVTFICVLKACGSIGSVELGKEIHREISEQGLLGKDIVLGTALVDMYAKCGVLEKAQDVLAELLELDVVSWNALISGYAQMGHAKRVFSLFNRMRGEGLMPDLVSFLILMTACNHAGLVNEGQVVFDDMCSIYHFLPSLEHYSCMVDLFCRAGHFTKVGIFLDKVPKNYYLPLCLAILGACHKWKNVELGRWAFEKLVELDAARGPAYVCMRNIYNAGSMYVENAHSQSRLRESNKILLMPASCWWIDDNLNVHSFACDSKLDTDISRLIYKKLESIRQRLSQEGSVYFSSETMLDKDDDGKDALCGHTEKLTIAYALINTPEHMPVSVTKNLRMCHDCHSIISVISRIENRKIHVKDAHGIHLFHNGRCICQNE